MRLRTAHFYHHARDEQPNPLDYKLHYEKGYEIFMFINGAGSFTIEGSKYDLEPYSILMMNSNELHVVNIAENLPYERIVLSMDANFLPPFMAGGIDFFRTIKFRKLGEDNQLSAEIVRASGLLELFGKLRQALEQRSTEHEMVAKCIIVQILSAINDLAKADLPSSSKRGMTRSGPYWNILMRIWRSSLRWMRCRRDFSSRNIIYAVFSRKRPDLRLINILPIKESIWPIN